LRVLFLVGGGVARLRLSVVLAWGALGAALWNAALLGLGYVVGYRIERIAYWVDRYSEVFLVVGVAGVFGYLLYKGWGWVGGE